MSLFERKKNPNNEDDSLIIPTFKVNDKKPIREEKHYEFVKKVVQLFELVLLWFYSKFEELKITAVSYKDYYLSKSQESGTGNVRLVDIALNISKDHGRNICYTLGGIFLTYIIVVYAPRLRKYVYIHTYEDNMNRTINDPFMFVDNDEETDWSMVFNHYDDDFIKWLATKQKYEVRVITEKDVVNGFLETEIFGVQGVHNVSFAILEDRMNKWSRVLGECVSAKNFGLPLNILFIKSSDHEKKHFLIEPKVVAHSPVMKEAEFFIPNIDNNGNHIWEPRKVEFPTEMIVGFLPYNYNDTQREVRLSNSDAVCISILAPRYVV